MVSERKIFRSEQKLMVLTESSKKHTEKERERERERERDTHTHRETQTQIQKMASSSNQDNYNPTKGTIQLSIITNELSVIMIIIISRIDRQHNEYIIATYTHTQGRHTYIPDDFFQIRTR
jgi:hypothetical protein